jgi:hypothetical protein
MTTKAFIPIGILLLGSVWLVLTMSGTIGSMASHAIEPIPYWLIEIGIFVTPFLCILCSLHLGFNWKVRLGALVTLLVCVPLLPFGFNKHPVLVTMVASIMFLEEFIVIPLVNRRLRKSNP